MAGRANRPKQTPGQTGHRANIGIGGMMGGLGEAAGGVSADAAGTGIADASGNSIDSSGALTPSAVGATAPGAPTFKPNHPILDMLFNGGRGTAAANAANIQGQQFQYQSGVQQDNALQLQHDNQTFELAKQKISADNVLTQAQKESQLRQVEQQQAANNALLTSRGVVASPANQQSYDNSVSPIAISAAQNLETANAKQAGNAAIQATATGDAMDKNFPAMVDTSSNQINTGNIASQGALANQPAVNAAQAFASKMQPSMIRAEASKGAMMQVPPGGSLFNTVSGKPVATAPYTDPSKGIDQIILNSGILQKAFPGSNMNTQGLPSGLGASPVTMPQQSATAIPPGAIKLPDGSILMPDGSKIPPQQ